VYCWQENFILGKWRAHLFFALEAELLTGLLSFRVKTFCTWLSHLQRKQQSFFLVLRTTETYDYIQVSTDIPIFFYHTRMFVLSCDSFTWNARIFGNNGCLFSLWSNTTFKQLGRLSRNTKKMQFVIESIIPKFTEGSACFELHTAHHQELQTVFAASGLYTLNESTYKLHFVLDYVLWSSAFVRESMLLHYITLSSLRKNCKRIF